MKVAELRTDLLHKIEGLNAHQLKEVYGLFENYMNNAGGIEEWDMLSREQKDKIEAGMREGKEGKTKPAIEVVANLRQKYGLNG